MEASIGGVEPSTEAHTRMRARARCFAVDMCRSNGFPIRSDLISDLSKTLGYIQAALLPLLSSLDAAGCGEGRCLIEIINEPEW